MSLKLDAEAARTGTRFRLFPQPRFLSAFRNPETVHIELAARVRPGRARRRSDVRRRCNQQGSVRPVQRTTVSRRAESGGGPRTGRPLRSPRPRQPGVLVRHHVRDGETDARNLGGLLRPFHPMALRSELRSLEMIPLIDWDNAQTGFGFLEFGFGRTLSGGIDRTRPYCQNFDVLAHELGHSIVFSQVGVPSSPLRRGDRLRRHARIGRRPRRHRRLAAFQLRRRSPARVHPRQSVQRQRARARRRALGEPRDSSAFNTCACPTSAMSRTTGRSR